VDIWKILTNFEAGQGKQIVTSREWTPLQIFLIEGQQANSVYQKCDGSDGASNFNWEITKIEWNVCERVVESSDRKTKSCQLRVINDVGNWLGLKSDSIEYMLIDNLHFDDGKEGG
jgi:hypothetical protein